MNPSAKSKLSWAKRADACIAHGALTNSKRHTHYPEGNPTHFVAAKGALAYEASGLGYIDYVQALGGSGIFGYRPQQIMDAVKAQLDLGTIFSMGSTLEVEVAEDLQRFFPDHPYWRFFKTGTEACMAAVRIARATTGRMMVLSEGYHGWSDLFVGLTPPALGVEQGFCQTYQPELLKQDVAAVIVEPVALDASPARIQSLVDLQAKAKDAGADLIFDEVVSCLRFPKGSVTRNYGLEPDIVVLGKALASGFPLAAVGMRKRHAQVDWFCSSTFAGDTMSLAAAKATLKLFRSSDMDWLWTRGQRFIDRFNALDPEIQIKGYPTRGAMDLEKPKVALFCQLMAKAAVLFGRAWLYTFAHPEHDDRVLNLAADAVRLINTGGVKLVGEPPRMTFRR